MKNIYRLLVGSFVVIAMASCGTTGQKASVIAAPDTTAVAKTDTVVKVVPNAEVLSIKELIDVFADESNADKAMAQYGYKVRKDYEVFRVDKYDKMYYKNCRLAKVITEGKFEDYPRALRAGISSFVAVKGESMMLGVFNNNAYQNLVDQVKMNGFRLDMEGNEDIYTDGKYYIACNKNNRTVRIQKM